MEAKPLNLQAALYIKAAKKLGIKYQIIHPAGLVRFYKNHKTTRIYKSQVEANNAVATLLARNKYHTNRLLKKAKLPVAKLSFCRSLEEALKATTAIGFPVVVKPTKGSRGHLTTLDITNARELKTAVNDIKTVNQTFLVEKFHQGNDYRFLVLDNTVIGIVKLKVPTITGDGKQTVRELTRALPRVKIDTEVRKLLQKQEQTLSSVLPKGKVIPIRQNANYSTGGTSETLQKNQVNPAILRLAVKAAKTMRITLAGIDMLLRDPKKTPEGNAVIIEVNSKPSLFIHHHPDRGTPQPVAETILRHLLHLKGKRV